MIEDKAGKIIESYLCRYLIGLEISIKGSNFIFDHL